MTPADIWIVILIVNWRQVTDPLYKLIANHTGYQKGNNMASVYYGVITRLRLPRYLRLYNSLVYNLYA
jgi:hypothetical protein